MSEVFDAGLRPGWSDLLAGRASLDEVAVPDPRVPGLRLVTAGLVTARPAEIFRDARLTWAFREMRAKADVIVVDSAPVLEDSHTLALARASDIVAMVADVRCTIREAVSAAVQQVRATGPQAIIGVLNGVPAPAEGRAQRIAVYEPRAGGLSASEAPAILADAVPPRGPNGQHREQSGAPHPSSRQPRDTETGPDDGPGSGEAHR